MPLPRYALYQKGVEMCVGMSLSPLRFLTQTTQLDRPHRRRPRHLGSLDAAHRARGPVLRHLLFVPCLHSCSLSNPSYPANQFIKSSDFPTSYPPLATRADLPAEGEIWCRGGSCIVDPLGRIIAGPLWDTEGIICAEVSAELVLRWRGV